MSIEYLTAEEVLAVGTIALGEPVVARDIGLLESAVGRPQASVFGQDAYPDLFVKAAALLHSIASNHALVDGNKRTAWVAAMAFLEINGFPLGSPLDTEKAEDLVLMAAQSQISLEEIADGLRNFAA